MLLVCARPQIVVRVRAEKMRRSLSFIFPIIGTKLRESQSIPHAHGGYSHPQPLHFRAATPLCDDAGCPAYACAGRTILSAARIGRVFSSQLFVRPRYPTSSSSDVSAGQRVRDTGREKFTPPSFGRLPVFSSVHHAATSTSCGRCVSLPRVFHGGRKVSARHRAHTSRQVRCPLAL